MTASPEVAHHHPQLQRVAHRIPPVDPDAPILLLLGRDILQVYKVRVQINSVPHVQRLDLGLVIVGEACLGTTHRPSSVHVVHPFSAHAQTKSITSQLFSRLSYSGRVP